MQCRGRANTHAQHPCRQMLEDMVAWTRDKPRWRHVSLLFVFAYQFLLRVPSEALPVVAGTSQSDPKQQVALWKDAENQALVLTLATRKNKPQGSRITRKCSCSASASTCAYHMIGPLLDAKPLGERLWPDVSVKGPQCTRHAGYASCLALSQDP